MGTPHGNQGPHSTGVGNSQTRPDHGVQWAELEQTPRHRPINFVNIEILGFPLSQREAVHLLLHLGDLG